MLDRISIPLSDGIAERHKARVTNHTSIFRHHHFGATLTMMMAAAATVRRTAPLLCAGAIHKRRCLQWAAVKYFVIHVSFIPYIHSSFGFWYLGHCNCVIFFPFFFRLAHLFMQNVNKDYVIFSYFRHNKSDQKRKME